ncbi:polysaccharide deacetylase family protein [Defluviitalea raffinosedens]|jgi:peptidoglycan/xylan/chitin deacetylase (PgdA/CDA1 family)|uniref:Polysaccharide deacetylase family protein n=1 Tax=Defluviitalea raffinosedens TaxID=1450156 RepID=A0A7C8LHC8_9FIRM|nr:polysaccharide deacetylase family protein [Defluviitalea raffinosedens]KAE9634956.1 polysaccharide deacetylase family protein [Defluviitalea raffinosedens]HHW66583.1 polysaccharide deacetylase family protein [Candidatus Epulonipiscium sp.]
MSVYYGKLLELVTINKKDDKYFLHIKISFIEDAEFYWEIDEYTANNLLNVTSFEGRYKYRISFYTSWNEIQKQYSGILIQTYRDQSQPIGFHCSENYIKALNKIRNIQHIVDLSKLSFISVKPFSSNDEKDSIKNAEQENTPETAPPKKFVLAYTKTTATFLSILFVILFSCSSQGFIIGKTKPGNQLFTQAAFIQTDVTPSYNQNSAIKDDVVMDDVINDEIVKENSLPEKPVQIESSIPFVELGETISYSIPKGSVALTFDDGPSNYSKDIVDILKKYDIGGTFFFIGLNAKKYPEHVQYVYSNGYSIGTHSMNHSNLTALSNERQDEELTQSSQLIESLTGEKLSLFRPPYGAMNQRIIELADQHECKIVLWNNDPEDWKGKNADAIVSHIKNTNTSGSIILLHESQATVEALPRIIEYLKEQNLEIVSLK